MEKLISIIVPVYNGERVLEKCLSCIANQTYKNLEIILVDDGSSDQTGRICDDFASKTPRTLVIHQENKGLWAARNVGLAHSTGDYVMFPDADDYFHLDTVRLLADAIDQDGKLYPLAFCSTKRTNTRREDIQSKIETRQVHLNREDLLNGLFINDKNVFGTVWNKLYRKQCLCHPFNEYYLRGQDFDANLRFFLSIQDAVFIDYPLYYYYQHPGQLTKKKEDASIRYNCEVRMLYRNYQDLSDENKKFGHFLLKRLYSRMAFYKAKRKVFRLSRETLDMLYAYEKATIKAFVSNKQISIGDRIRLLALLHGGAMTRLVLRITNNY